MYLNGDLDVDVEDPTVFDKVIVQYAGKNTFGASTVYTARYTISMERIVSGQTPCLSGFGVDAHEFGHLLGFFDLHDQTRTTYGVGYFSLMGWGASWNIGKFLPSHLDPWYKLRSGWLDYDILSGDAANYELYPVEDTSGIQLPKVAVLKGRRLPGTNNWDGTDLEYFILENRSTIGFDERLKFYGYDNFKGGIVIWHYDGDDRFPNHYNLLVVEADADSLFPYGNMAVHRDSSGSNAGNPNDVFPGLQNVTNVNDLGYPNLNLHNGSYSHLGLQGIDYTVADTLVRIDSIKTQNFALVINRNTTWNGTIILDRDVFVVDGAVLSIEPGTIIEAEVINGVEKVEVIVESNSRIEAIGTESSPIIFQSASTNPTGDDWGGLVFRGGSQGTLTYIEFRNAENAVTSNFETGGKLEVSFCRFDSTGISLEHADSATVIKNCFFDKGYLILSEGDASTIKNNLMVSENRSGYAIWSKGNDSTLTTIMNNTIAFYERDLLSYGAWHSPTVKNNILYGNSISMYHHGTISYNCFWNDDTPAYPLPDTTNIKADPLFVDAAGGDFHLKSISPCIDRGDPNDDYSNEPHPNGGRINMGAYGNTPEATLSFDIIAQNDLTADTTWSGWVNVLEDISTNHYSLTVEPGTKVLFDDGKTLTINGDFSCDGQPNPYSEPDSILFSGYRPGDRMGGVFIDGDGGGGNTVRYTQFERGDVGLLLKAVTEMENTFEHLSLEDHNTGLYLSESMAQITSSAFKNNQSGLIADYSSVNIYGSDFDRNGTQGLYLSNSAFDISENTFQDNGLRGVYFQYSSDGMFHNNTVIGNGGETTDPSEIRGGLVFYQSEPIITTNFITQNQASGIFSLSSSYPIMNYDRVNLVSENGAPQEDFSEIMVKDISFPLLDNGHNDIMDSTGRYLIYGDEDPRDIEIDITHNYWGTVDAEEIERRVFRPSGFIFDPFDLEPNTQYPPGSGGGEEEMFEMALSAEMDSNYVYAVSVYDSIIQLHPASVHAKAALGRIFHSKIKLQEPPAAIKSYFDALSNHSDEGIATVAKRLSLRSLTLDEQYQSAIDGHTLWSQTTPYVSDSIYSEVDILTNQLKQSGNRLNKGAASTFASRRVELASFREYQRKTESILNALFRSGRLSKLSQVPQTFQLLQNYPNPFNPATTIKYQLPKATKVRLEIYNILGQRVRTLVEARQAADYYTLQWDGRNSHGRQVGSGLYIYRLIAEPLDGSGGFVKARKMILIR